MICDLQFFVFCILFFNWIIENILLYLLSKMKSIHNHSSEKGNHAQSDEGSNPFSDFSSLYSLTKKSESNELTGSNLVDDRELLPYEIMEWETTNVELDEMSEAQIKSINDDNEEEK